MVEMHSRLQDAGLRVVGKAVKKNKKVHLQWLCTHLTQALSQKGAGAEFSIPKKMTCFDDITDSNQQRIKDCCEAGFLSAKSVLGDLTLDMTVIRREWQAYLPVLRAIQLVLQTHKDAWRSIVETLDIAAARKLGRLDFRSSNLVKPFPLLPEYSDKVGADVGVV